MAFENGSSNFTFVDNTAPGFVLTENYKGDQLDATWVETNPLIGSSGGGGGATGNGSVSFAEQTAGAGPFVFSTTVGFRSDGTDDDNFAHTTFLTDGNLGVELLVSLEGGVIIVKALDIPSETVRANLTVGTILSLLSNGEKQVKLTLTLTDNGGTWAGVLDVEMPDTGRTFTPIVTTDFTTAVDITHVEHWVEYNQGGGQPILLNFIGVDTAWGDGIGCPEPRIYDLVIGDGPASSGDGAQYTNPPVIGVGGNPNPADQYLSIYPPPLYVDGNGDTATREEFARMTSGDIGG